MIAIIDYDIGNIGSILNMLKHIGSKAVCTSDPEMIGTAEKLILPGVGSFDQAMTRLAANGLIDPLNRRVIEAKTPILGICLGMQLFTRSSEEGRISGLGWLDATVKRFDFKGCDLNLKIPHMGWNSLEIRKDILLFRDMHVDHRFYFVHSYHIDCRDPADVACVSHYGYPFTSVIQKKNIFGVQFHPEKSHRYGMQILKNFADI